MDISTRLKQWHDTFLGELNGEAERIQNMVMRAFEIYKLPPINDKGIITPNPKNEMMLKKLIDKMVPKAWGWEISCVGLEPRVFLMRFVGFIVDEEGDVL